MTIKAIAGDWAQNRTATVQKTWGGRSKGIALPKGLFETEVIRAADIASVEVVTESNEGELRNKLWAGAIGGALFGPVGLLAGIGLAQGNRQRIVALELRDGRGCVLVCSSNELGSLFDLKLFAEAKPRDDLFARLEAIRLEEPDPKVRARKAAELGEEMARKQLRGSSGTPLPEAGPASRAIGLTVLALMAVGIVVGLVFYGPQLLMLLVMP